MLTLPTAGELLGVKGRVTRADVPEMKRAALLFDRISMAATIGWSADGIGVDADVGETENSRNLFSLQPLLDGDVVDSARVRRLTREPEAEDEVARMLAAAIRARYGADAVAFVRTHTLSGPTTHLSEALQVAVNQLPLPQEDTPWEAIWDWRNDRDARRMYLRFRTWINRIASTHASVREMSDEAASQLADYQAYMAIHHRHMRQSRVEVFVTTTAEIIESLATFRLSSAVSRLFDLRRSEIRLLKGELDAPGREVAYIDAAQRRFG